MYVPPIKGSAICVWKAVMPTNWTVLYSQVNAIPAEEKRDLCAYLAREDSKVVATTSVK